MHFHKNYRNQLLQGSIVEYGVNGRNHFPVGKFGSEIEDRKYNQYQYGDSRYRGNAPAELIFDFLHYCEKKNGHAISSCSDYMNGSGTTEDVCKVLGIPGTYWDLSMGKNLLEPDLEIPDNPEVIMFHPPYSKHINIPYAGKQWDDEEYEKKYGYNPRKYDLGRMEWTLFIKSLNYCMIKLFSALEAGGFLGLLCGDIRRNGQYYSMFNAVAKPGNIESIVIKKQNHTTSGRINYSGGNFIPIQQEYFLILKKLLPYCLNFTYIKTAELDIRDSSNATWKDVVYAICRKHNKPLSLPEIYREMEGRKKTETNKFWKEKIRQTLQQNDCFTRIDIGIYALAA